MDAPILSRSKKQRVIALLTLLLVALGVAAPASATDDVDRTATVETEPRYQPATTSGEALGVVSERQRTNGASTASSGYTYQCYAGVTPVTSTSYFGPTECPNGVWYMLDSNWQTVAAVNNRVNVSSPLIDAIRSGYNAVNRWCSDNTAACGVLTSIAVQYMVRNQR